MLTASSLPRASHCAASAALPAIRDTSEAAERGTAIHLYLASVHALGHQAAAALIPDEYRAEVEVLDLDSLPVGDGYQVEVPLALDVLTGRGRPLPTGDGHRDYAGVTPTEVPGTADVQRTETREELGIPVPTGHVRVWDYKTGRSPVDPPAVNLQLAHNALALGARTADVALVHIHEDGSSYTDSARLDELDLDAARRRIRKTVGAVHEAKAQVIRGEVPDVHVGTWCAYCPAQAACPSQGALLAKLIRSPVTVAEEAIEQLTPEHAVEAYILIERAEDAVQRAKRAMYAYARENPIHLPTGDILGLKVTERESLVGPVARRVIEDLHGRAVAEAASIVKVTKSGLRDQLRRVAAETGVKLAHLERSALAAIAAEGGVTSKESESVGIYRPRGAPAANEPTPDPFARTGP